MKLFQNRINRFAAGVLLGCLVVALLQNSGGGALPNPFVEPPPIDDPGKHIVIVRETDPTLPGGITTQMADVLNSGLWQEPWYAAGGKIVQYDPTQDVSSEPVYYQKAFATAKENHPYFLLSNGRTGIQGKVPNNTQEMVSIVQKYTE